jgi:two-component system response regulator DevR
MIVILTSFLDETLLKTCVSLGVRGYIVKTVEGFDLVQSLRKIMDGGAVLDPQATEVMLQWIQHGARGGLPAPLNAHEVTILRLVAEGLTNREIGRTLFLSENTIRARVNDIVHRLHARNRVEAVMIAQRHGLL